MNRNQTIGAIIVLVLVAIFIYANKPPKKTDPEKDLKKALGEIVLKKHEEKVKAEVDKITEEFTGKAEKVEVKTEKVVVKSTPPASVSPTTSTPLEPVAPTASRSVPRDLAFSAASSVRGAIGDIVSGLAEGLVGKPDVVVATTPTTPEVVPPGPPVISSASPPSGTVIMVPPGSVVAPASPALPPPPVSKLTGLDIIKGLGNKDEKEASRYAQWLIKQPDIGKALADALSESSTMIGSEILKKRIIWCMENIGKTLPPSPREVKLRKELAEIVAEMEGIAIGVQNGYTSYTVLPSNRLYFGAGVWPWGGYYGYGTFPVAYGDFYGGTHYVPMTKIHKANLRQSYKEKERRKFEIEKELEEFKSL